MYTKKELEILNQVSMEIIGREFETLDADDQDWIYCEAADNGLI